MLDQFRENLPVFLPFGFYDLDVIEGAQRTRHPRIERVVTGMDMDKAHARSCCQSRQK